jgi:hypothetical protein
LLSSIFNLKKKKKKGKRKKEMGFAIKDSELFEGFNVVVQNNGVII